MPILPMSCSRAACPMSVASAGVEAELERQQLARAADAVGVLARLVVAVLGRECEPVEHLELGVLELARALGDAFVQQVVVALRARRGGSASAAGCARAGAPRERRSAW